MQSYRAGFESAVCTGRSGDGQGRNGAVMERPRNDETPANQRGFLVVAPTGIDPVTFRFSVERSTN